MDPQNASQSLSEFVNDDEINITPIDVNVVSLILEDLTNASSIEDDKVSSLIPCAE